MTITTSLKKTSLFVIISIFCGFVSAVAYGCHEPDWYEISDWTVFFYETCPHSSATGIPLHWVEADLSDYTIWSPFLKVGSDVYCDWKLISENDIDIFKEYELSFQFLAVVWDDLYLDCEYQFWIDWDTLEKVSGYIRDYPNGSQLFIDKNDYYLYDSFALYPYSKKFAQTDWWYTTRRLTNDWAANTMEVIVSSDWTDTPYSRDIDYFYYDWEILDVNPFTFDILDADWYSIISDSDYLTLYINWQLIPTSVLNMHDVDNLDVWYLYNSPNSNFPNRETTDVLYYHESNWEIYFGEIWYVDSSFQVSHKKHQKWIGWDTDKVFYKDKILLWLDPSDIWDHSSLELLWMATNHESVRYQLIQRYGATSQEEVEFVEYFENKFVCDASIFENHYTKKVHDILSGYAHLWIDQKIVWMMNTFLAKIEQPIIQEICNAWYWGNLLDCGKKIRRVSPLTWVPDRYVEKVYLQCTHTTTNCPATRPDTSKIHWLENFCWYISESNIEIFNKIEAVRSFFDS